MTTFVRRTPPRMLLATLCAVGTAPTLNAAQQQNGTLEGTVQDLGGVVVDSAAVMIRETDTGLTRATQADAVDAFRVTDLRFSIDFEF